MLCTCLFMRQWPVTISVASFIFVLLNFKMDVASEGLMLAFYEADFVGADIKFQKALIFLMTRAQKSVVFTIGNFTPLSMGTIVTVSN
ncbi:hypothetical protein RI129_004637 [Pyrocoelia pectoralis]|uniref:Uncharacterized protein n=1 Tax=Pyrocoelia pectoralis TaxID=417401 RepID=A0AAN7VJ97_9COLE